VATTPQLFDSCVENSSSFFLAAGCVGQLEMMEGEDNREETICAKVLYMH
jgi:hypothetical protein